MTMANTLSIKGMVCSRCVAVLKADLIKIGVTAKEVSMGRVVIDSEVNDQQLQQIQALLLDLGFDLLIDKQARLVHQIKEVIHNSLAVNVVHGSEGKMKLSSVLADTLNLSYSTLSEIFTRSEGITIEQYIIQRRLNKVKELLEHTPNTFTEIAYLTGFSSVHHFSKHFKDMTGFSPSQYRSLVKPALTLAGA